MTNLLHSRKFWLTVWALAQTIAGHYLTVPHDIIMTADALVMILVGAIAYEDGERSKADAAIAAFAVPPDEPDHE